MGHYVRLLSPGDAVPSVDALQSALKESGRSETIAVEAGTTENWTQLILAHDDGSEIAAVERNPVAPGQLGATRFKSSLTRSKRPSPNRRHSGLRSICHG